MSLSPFPDTLIYNTVEKVEAYWKNLKPSAAGSPDSYQEKWKISLQLLEQVSRQNNLVIALFDCNVNQFIYAVDRSGLLGYDVSQFLTEDGLTASLSNIHPDYLDGCLLMQKEGFDRFSDGKSVVVSWDYLYRKRNGNYFRMMQQAMPVEYDPNDNPVLILSYIYDVTHLKKEDTANLIIAATGKYRIYNYDLEKHHLEEIKPLTEQEMKVLIELSEGKHTKQIATELAISPHTIDTHRRHLLTKTNCVDTTALITYAKMTGII
jgi:DNA-binding CsgD family transcriptional regulator